MKSTSIKHDELKRRKLQEYIFGLEEIKEQAENLEREREELKHAQDLLLAILGSTTHGIFLVKNNAFSWCNAGLSKILGWTNQELIGKPISILFGNGGDSERFMSEMGRQMGQKGEAETEFSLVAKTGEILSCLVSAKPLSNNDESNGVIFSVADITERKNAENRLRKIREELKQRVEERTMELAQELNDRQQAETRLKQSENLYRTTFERTGTAMILVDANSTILKVNTQFEQLSGYSRKELEGKKNWHIFIDPIDLPKMKHFHENRRQGMDAPNEYEFIFLDRYGEKHTALNSTCLIPGTNFVLASIIDITYRKRAEEALRQSEAQLRLITDSLPMMIAYLDSDLRHRFCNSRYKEMCRKAPSEIVGKRISQVIGPQLAEFHISHLHKCARGEQICFQSPGKGDQKGKQFEITYLPHLGRDGSLTGIFVVVVDITERSHAEKEKRELEERLRQSQKMEAVGTLAGGIAHDFNNILQIISGFVQLLDSRRDMGEQSRKHLHEIQGAAERGAGLVKRLLTFSRRVEANPIPLDLNGLVSRSVKLLKRTIPKMISIETSLANDLKVIKGDVNQLEQVMLNLGSNARDAMPYGGRLLIETRNVHVSDPLKARQLGVETGDYAVLQVSDNGQGIQSKDIEQIFDPFFTTKAVGNGTGLGLSTVFGIVKGHSGGIACSSHPDKGTTFQIFLPLMDADSLAQAEAEHLPGKTADLRGDETVLLVDDEPTILSVATELLENFGYHVLSADSGEKALEELAAQPGKVDLVILDLGMPGMGGRACLQKITEGYPHICVVIASGYAEEGLSAEIMGSGAHAFLPKPYGLTRLIRTIRKLLDKALPNP